MTSDRLHPIRLLAAVAAMVLATVLVAAAGTQLVLPSTAVGAVDDAGVAWGTGLTNEHEWLLKASFVWARLSLPGGVHLLVLAVVVVFVLQRRVPERALLLVPVGPLGWTLEAVCKQLVARPRPAPTHPVTTAGGWSYPSGHATNAALGAVLLIVLLAAIRTAWVRWGATLLTLLATAATGLDRILLGVHYFSDVAVGLTFGAVLGLLGAWGLGLIGPRSGLPLRSPSDA